MGEVIFFKTRKVLSFGMSTNHDLKSDSLELWQIFDFLSAFHKLEVCAEIVTRYRASESPKEKIPDKNKILFVRDVLHSKPRKVLSWGRSKKIKLSSYSLELGRKFDSLSVRDKINVCYEIMNRYRASRKPSK